MATLSSKGQVSFLRKFGSRNGTELTLIANASGDTKSGNEEIRSQFGRLDRHVQNMTGRRYSPQLRYHAESGDRGDLKLTDTKKPLLNKGF